MLPLNTRVFYTNVYEYMYSYRTVMVRTSRFGAWGLTTNTGNSPEGGTHRNATLFDNRQRQQKNSKCRELRAWDSDHVLILNASLTWTDKIYHMDWQEPCAHAS